VTDEADLVLVERFLNTLDERSFSRHGRDHVATDELSSVEALSAWLQTQNLVTGTSQLQPADLTAALDLRAALRAALSSGGDGARAVAVLAGFPLQLVADSSGGLRLVAARRAEGLDTIVETVAVSVASGRWSRLKLCASPDCRWAFYDTSRNGAGRWCSMEVCGNRHKTRIYRQRHVA
jgi:predicted RNA-binding Zn ribbon-like protein